MSPARSGRLPDPRTAVERTLSPCGRRGWEGSAELLKRVLNKAKHVYRSVVVDRATRRFIAHNRPVWRSWRKASGDSVVLVDLYGVAETLVTYSYFLNILADKHNAAVKSFSASTGDSSLHRIYRSFNTTGHIVTSALSEEQERRRRATVQDVLPTLKTKQDIFDLTVSGIWLGIDVYETYLRNGSKPTVLLDDPLLFTRVEEGIGLVIFWQDFFTRNRPKAVVVSHDCYLDGDVVCKVAYQAGVPVYLPNAAYPTYVQSPHSVHSYFGDYREMFRRLSPEEQKNGLAWAKRQLERRLSGEVGVDMPYTSKSAFQSSGNEERVLRQSQKIKVLICSHCFYDNPHGLGGMLFLDFYEWLRYLGRISERTDYDWYLKVHPDPMPGTLETIREILDGFPNITLVPHETSHHQLAREGIDFVLTVYGSVGHEYPALGVQVINAGYNPRVAYDFNWHPKSLEEYEEYLLNLKDLRRKIDLEDLYEFYYMHHYYVYADNLVFNSYRQLLSDLTPEQRIGSAVYGYFLEQWSERKHEEIIDNMRRLIESGKHHYWSRGPE